MRWCNGFCLGNLRRALQDVLWNSYFNPFLCDGSAAQNCGTPCSRTSLLQALCGSPWSPQWDAVWLPSAPDQGCPGFMTENQGHWEGQRGVRLGFLQLLLVFSQRQQQCICHKGAKFSGLVSKWWYFSFQPLSSSTVTFLVLLSWKAICLNFH